MGQQMTLSFTVAQERTACANPVLPGLLTRAVAQKRHRLDAVAVLIADEGRVVGLVVCGPQAGRAIRGAAGPECGGVEGVDRFGVRRAQADMSAAVLGDA